LGERGVAITKTGRRADQKWDAGRVTCPCRTEPLASPCCEWPGNVRLCVCADEAVIAETGAPAPS
jgi:hypothetical protein